MYFLGVGAGLTIAWITGAIGYFIDGTNVLTNIVALELIISAASFLTAYLSRKNR